MRKLSFNSSTPQITSFSNFFSGDPYIGSNRDELKKKNERIADLEKEIKRLKAETNRNSFSRGRDLSRVDSAEDKKKRYKIFIRRSCNIFHWRVDLLRNGSRLNNCKLVLSDQ